MANPVVPNSALAIWSNMISGLGGTVPRYIGHGIGTTAAAITDTALQTPADSRATGTVSRVTTTATNDSMQVVGTIACGSTEVITEVALFDAVAAGNMAVRAVVAAINVTNVDSIAWTLKVVWTGG